MQWVPHDDIVATVHARVAESQVLRADGGSRPGLSPGPPSPAGPARSVSLCLKRRPVALEVFRTRVLLSWVDVALHSDT